MSFGWNQLRLWQWMRYTSCSLLQSANVFLEWPCSKDSLWITALLTISGIQKHEYLVYLWPGYPTELRILSWTIPRTFNHFLLGQWGGVQHKWYQGSKSCLFFWWSFVQDVLSCPGKKKYSEARNSCLNLKKYYSWDKDSCPGNKIFFKSRQGINILTLGSETIIQ